MKNACFLIGIALLLLATGCVNTRNGFSQFYRDNAGLAITNLQPYSGSTKIVNGSSDQTKDMMDAYRNGWMLTGMDIGRLVNQLSKAHRSPKMR